MVCGLPSHIVRHQHVRISVSPKLAIQSPEKGCGAFERGDDLHVLTAAAINVSDPAQVTTEQRTSAKAANFGLIPIWAGLGLRLDGSA